LLFIDHSPCCSEVALASLIVLDLNELSSGSLDTIKACKTGFSQPITPQNLTLVARCTASLTNALRGLK
jgi:hypothetical protein